MAENEIKAGADDRVAIITGGGSGIGEATAKLLASKGLGRRDRRAHAGEARGGRRRRSSRRAAALGRFQPTSPILTPPTSIVERVHAAAGRIDVLVNNAAAIRVGTIEQFSHEELDRHLATNIRSPFLLVSESLPYLRESPAAAVVNISSTIGSPLVKPGNAVYGMTKASLEYFTRAAAHELATYGIRVNCISPGSVVTPIHLEWAGDLEYAKEHLKERIPMGRMGEPEEIAIWIWQLVRPETVWCTGATINVDGGQALGLPEDLPEDLPSAAGEG